MGVFERHILFFCVKSEQRPGIIIECDIKTMNACSSPPEFYAAVGKVCGSDLRSAECQRAVSDGVDRFGLGCLALPIAEGNPLFPPFVGYVCPGATGRLGEQCGQWTPTGAGAGASAGAGAGASAGLGALAGATVVAGARKFGGMLRTGAPTGGDPETEIQSYDTVDLNECRENKLMCVTDAELDTILGTDNPMMKDAYSAESDGKLPGALIKYKEHVMNARRNGLPVEKVLSNDVARDMQAKYIGTGSHMYRAVNALENATRTRQHVIVESVNGPLWE
jgi:hypothetical protein